jgi:hypothetical protein
MNTLASYFMSYTIIFPSVFLRGTENRVELGYNVMKGTEYFVSL